MWNLRAFPGLDKAALRFGLALAVAVDGLGFLPARGRPLADGGRELVFGGYLVRYRIEGSEVLIDTIRSRHRGR